MYSMIIILNLLILIKTEQMIFAEVYTRHGARSPTDLSKGGEDFINEIWADRGELTSVGYRMHYVLGMRNRNRYVKKYKLVSENFDPHELLIFSTEKNRTILSMVSHLQGLYPIHLYSGDILTDEQVTLSIPPVDIANEEIETELIRIANAALPYQMRILPIHTFTKYDKKILNFELSECSWHMKELKNKNLAEKESLKILTK